MSITTTITKNHNYCPREGRSGWSTVKESYPDSSGKEEPSWTSWLASPGSSALPALEIIRPLLLTCPPCFSTPAPLSLLTNDTGSAQQMFVPHKWLPVWQRSPSQSLGICMDYGFDDWCSPRGQEDKHKWQEIKDSSHFSPATSLPHWLSCSDPAPRINRNIVTRTRVRIFPLYLELMRSHFIFSVPLWAFHFTEILTKERRAGWEKIWKSGLRRNEWRNRECVSF